MVPACSYQQRLQAPTQTSEDTNTWVGLPVTCIHDTVQIIKFACCYNYCT